MKTLIRLTLLLGVSLTATTAAAELIGPEEAEQARLRRHFDRVGEVMTEHTPEGLDEAALANRRAIIAELGRYAEQGRFPRNSRHFGERRPYFIDDEGQACAMGHLLMTSGYQAAARDIAVRQNNAYLHDIESGAMAPWLAQHGVTLEEAALIQPSYCSCPAEEVPVCGEHGFSYINECVATQCGGVEVVSCGPCDPFDDLSDDYNDPDRTMAEYCAQNTCVCYSADDSDGSCTVDASRPPGSRGAGWAALLALALAGGLYRRRRR